MGTKQKTYNKRVWLNRENSPSTGSVVVYDGPITFIKGDEKEHITFIEIGSCHDKARLHRAADDSKEDFVNKMLLLRDTIDEFIEYLRAEENN